jgi:hypothetical protein
MQYCACMCWTAGATQCMASMKIVVLNQALLSISDGAQEQKGRVVGKSGDASVCHGWFGMQACLVPGHPAARAHVAPPPSASSPARSFQSLVKNEYSGEQWARYPEKGEECIRPPCRLLSHAHPKRGGQLGYLNCCHFHPPLKEVPLNTSKRCA